MWEKIKSATMKEILQLIITTPDLSPNIRFTYTQNNITYIGDKNTFMQTIPANAAPLSNVMIWHFITKN